MSIVPDFFLLPVCSILKKKQFSRPVLRKKREKKKKTTKYYILKSSDGFDAVVAVFLFSFFFSCSNAERFDQFFTKKKPANRNWLKFKFFRSLFDVTWSIHVEDLISSRKRTGKRRQKRNAYGFVHSSSIVTTTKVYKWELKSMYGRNVVLKYSILNI